MTTDSERQRRFRITIRLTKRELTNLSEAAERANACISSYARSVLAGTELPRVSKRAPVEAAQLARILGQFGKIGSNLNQIAHAVNAKACGIELMPFVERELARSLFELRDARNVLLKALGRGTPEA
jgi:hypothetical protein